MPLCSYQKDDFVTKYECSYDVHKLTIITITSSSFSFSRVWLNFIYSEKATKFENLNPKFD